MTMKTPTPVRWLEPLNTLLNLTNYYLLKKAFRFRKAFLLFFKFCEPYIFPAFQILISTVSLWEERQRQLIAPFHSERLRLKESVFSCHLKKPSSQRIFIMLKSDSPFHSKWQEKSAILKKWSSRRIS